MSDECSEQGGGVCVCVCVREQARNDASAPKAAEFRPGLVWLLLCAADRIALNEGYSFP